MVLLVELGCGLRRLIGQALELVDGVGDSLSGRLLHGHCRQADLLDLVDGELAGADYLGQSRRGLPLGAGDGVDTGRHGLQLTGTSPGEVAGQDQLFIELDAFVAALLPGQD
ncbi:hypothetical protein D3C80_1750580 [compost metagenome]